MFTPFEYLFNHPKLLIKPLKSEDFSRWRLYARYVRDICLYCETEDDLDNVYGSMQSTTLLALWQAATGEVLLPALQEAAFEGGIHEPTLVFWKMIEASMGVKSE